MSAPTCWPIHAFVTHPRPHLDELSAIWAVQRFGLEKYPGADRAEIEYFDPQQHLDVRSEEEWLGDGYLFIGVGGGRYDDHPHERFPHDCALTLVLNDLGKLEDPALQKIVHDVFTEDRKGSPCALHLASIIKARHRIVGILDTLNDVTLSLEALYAAQHSFLEAVEIVRQGRLILVTNQQTERTLVLAEVESANEDVSRAARWREGAHAALVIQRHPLKPDDPAAGTTFISASRDLGIRDVRWLTKELRWAEQVAKGDIRVRDQKRLMTDGVLPEVEEWYHHEAAAQIYNGTLTAPHVPRTRLSLEHIKETGVRFLRTYPLRTPNGGGR